MLEYSQVHGSPKTLKKLRSLLTNIVYLTDCYIYSDYYTVMHTKKECSAHVFCYEPVMYVLYITMSYIAATSTKVLKLALP